MSSSHGHFLLYERFCTRPHLETEAKVNSEKLAEAQTAIHRHRGFERQRKPWVKCSDAGYLFGAQLSRESKQNIQKTLNKLPIYFNLFIYFFFKP